MKIKQALRICLFLLPAFIVCGKAWAGSSTGVITELLTEKNTVKFKAGNHTGKPACSTANYPGSWAFSLDTTGGRGMLALLLTAQARGKSVYVQGTNQCTAWGDRETPDYVILAN